MQEMLALANAKREGFLHEFDAIDKACPGEFPILTNGTAFRKGL